MAAMLVGAVLTVSSAAAGAPATSIPTCSMRSRLRTPTSSCLFVAWPSNAVATRGSPVVLCAADRGPLDPAIDRALAGQRTGSRPIVVRHVDGNGVLRSRSVLFESVPDNQTFAQARDLPVLSVSDSNGGSAHGIITFVVVAHHVRFGIGENAASQHGLQISSQLLELAHDIGGKGKVTR